MKALIDTGIFVQVLSKERGFQSSFDLLEKIKNKKIEGFISVMTIAEIISIFYRVGEGETAAAKASIQSLVGEDRIVPITAELAESAGRVKAKFKLSLGDAFIIATAISIDCEYLVTLDPEIKRIDNILTKVKSPNELLSLS